MPFEPEELPPATPPFFEDAAGDAWAPLFRHDCGFGPDVFADKMMNMVRNPNLNSTWLFRADILYDDDERGAENGADSAERGSEAGVDPVSQGAETDVVRPVPRDVAGFMRRRTLVRKLIPRNDRRDDPLDQTCTFHRSEPTTTPVRSLVLYMPHASSAADLPFYHPKVRGIAHMHEWDPLQGSGSVSVHFLPFQESDLQDKKIRRTAFHLLEILHKHGQGAAVGYVKRVHHDVVIPQARFQDRYASLKNKYARRLVDSWAESTDPTKHVFEDLGIAAFLMELWADMYKGAAFPGFVDIGCGNGLLVYILTQEGYAGWGFDARARKSWAQYNGHAPSAPSGKSLEQRILLPRVVLDAAADPEAAQISPEEIHDGLFPPGTFIVSNHADELTPWTPILGALSRCPFIMIPCCSHSLTGDKFRAPPPRDKTKSKSVFSSLVDWVTRIAEDCGWEAETEMLRIPSTRNTCVLGRRRAKDLDDGEVHALLRKYGGAEGFYANVAKLVKTGPRGH